MKTNLPYSGRVMSPPALSQRGRFVHEKTHIGMNSTDLQYQPVLAVMVPGSILTDTQAEMNQSNINLICLCPSRAA